MSQVLNSEFRRAPKRFLEEHALSIPNSLGGGEPQWINGLGRRLGEADAQPETRIAPVRGNVLRLRGFGREPVRKPAIHCDLDLADEEYVARFQLSGGKDSFPAYFLPFQKDRITYVELSPDSGVEYFFAPAATGHTIFVTGTQEQPTVYQANAFSTAAEDEGLAPTPDGNKLREAYIDALFELANPNEEPLLYKLKKPLLADPEPEPNKRGQGREGTTVPKRKSRTSRPRPERIAVVGWLSRGRWLFHYQTSDPSARGEMPHVAPLPEAGSEP